MPKSVGTTEHDIAQEMNALRARYETLKDEKTRCETNLENSKKRLDELKEKARTEYGTDDLEALRSKLEEMRSENSKRQREYEASLNAIEAELLTVDEAYQKES